MSNCNACGKPIEAPFVTVTFTGLPGSRLTGMSFEACAGCITLRVPDRSAPLPERVSDPVAEPDMVEVKSVDDGYWRAYCHECLRSVALKDERDDAELAAATHIAHNHAGIAA